MTTHTLKNKGGVLFISPVYSTSGLESVYIFSETNENYLIDPSEDTVRGLISSEGFGLLKTNNILLTTLSWDKISGLLGLYLALKTSNQQVNIYGPPGLKRFFQNASFINNADHYQIFECDGFNYNEFGSILNVKSIPIHSNNKQNNSQTSRKPKVVPIGTASYKLALSKELKNQLSHPKNSPTLCYYFETKPTGSKFDTEKANSLGLFDYRKFRSLTQGKEVENDLPDRRIIKPTDIFKIIDGIGSIFINCPDESYFDSLFEHPFWEELSSKKKTLTFVLHSSPREVLNHPKYIKFMEKITCIPSIEEKTKFEQEYNIKLEKAIEEEYSGKGYDKAKLDEIKSQLTIEDEITLKVDLVAPVETKHVIISNEFSSLIQPETNIVDIVKSLAPQLAPPKADTWEPDSIQVALDRVFQSDILKDRVMIMKNRQKYVLAPARSRGKIIDYKTNSSPAEEASYIPSFVGPLKQLTIKRIQDFANNLPKDQVYPKCMFLGTASSVPNTQRNVSGILLSPSEDNHMLVDCGTSTASQMELFFCREENKKVLRDTHLVWVSHLHADHHLGIGTIAQERKKAFKEIGIDNPTPLVVLVPNTLIPWFRDFQEFGDCNIHVVAIGDYSNLLDEVCKKLSITSLSSVPVVHCHQSFGLSVVFQNKEHIKKPYKLVYSGDTRPSNLLVAAGKNCDLLIHEATFTDEYQSDAIAKRHSTFSEALGVAKAMEAKNTILTHFSQRYPLIIRTTDNDSQVNGLVKNSYALALDLMRFSPTDFPLIQEINYTFDRLLSSCDNKDNRVYSNDVSLEPVLESSNIKNPKRNLKSYRPNETNQQYSILKKKKRQDDEAIVPVREYTTFNNNNNNNNNNHKNNNNNNYIYKNNNSYNKNNNINQIYKRSISLFNKLKK